MRGDALKAALLRVGERALHRHGHRIGLRAFAHGDDRLRDGQPCFRHADGVQRLPRRGRGQHGVRIGHAHVLGRVHDHPAHNDARIHARVIQPCKPRQRRVGVRPAKRLAERAEHVVKQALVHSKRLLLHRIRRHLARDVYPPRASHRRGQHRDFQRVQRRAHISARRGRNQRRRVVVQRHAHAAVPALLVRAGAPQRFDHVRVRQRFKAKQAAAAHDGGRHGDHGILRGGADEAHDTLFNGGQDAVRLRL